MVLKQAIILSILLFLIGCVSHKEQLDGDVLSYCFRENDSTMHIKITNFSKGDIYLPGQYFGYYTLNEDTVHLEGFDNPKYKTTYYYKYEKVLPFTFYTTKQVNGGAPDSTIKIVDQFYFNQFKVRPFTILNKDSTHVYTLHFNVPSSATTATVVFYQKSFFETDAGKKGYVMEDFISFEEKYAKHAVSPLYHIYGHK